MDFFKSFPSLRPGAHVVYWTKAYHMDFFGRMFVSYLALTFILTGISLVAVSRYTDRYLQKEFDAQYQELCVRTLSQSDEWLREMDRISLYVLSEPNLRKILTRRELQEPGDYFEHHYDALVEARSILSAINGPGDSVMRISFLTDAGTYLGFGLKEDYREDIRATLRSGILKDTMARTAAQGGAKYLPPPDRDCWNHANGEKVFSDWRQYRDVERAYGYVQVQQPVSSLENVIRQATPGTSVELRDARGNLAIGIMEGVRYGPVFTATSGYSGWTLRLRPPRKEFTQVQAVFRFFFIALGMVTFILGAIGNALLGSRLSKPLYELRDKTRSVGPDNMRIQLDSRDAPPVIRELNADFERMFNQLERSMNEMVEIRQSELRSHLAALRAQIDPHYLYNMLSLIAVVGAEDGSERTEIIANRLARSLRYSACGSDAPVTVDEEFRHLEDYLALMNARYEGLFTYHLSLAPAVRDVRIPRFILQPLAENCFKHGFHETGSPWVLSVEAATDGTSWRVAVKDNGKGFSADAEKRANGYRAMSLAGMKQEVLSTTEAGGIGLANVVLRLRLVFGEAAIFSVTSTAEGATVTVGGPVNAPGLHR